MLVRRVKKTENRMLRLKRRFCRNYFKGVYANKYFKSQFLLISNRLKIFSLIMCLIPAHYSIIIMNHLLFIIHYCHFVQFQYSTYDQESHVLHVFSDFFHRILLLNFNCWVTGHCHIIWNLGNTFYIVIIMLVSPKQFHLKVALCKLPTKVDQILYLRLLTYYDPRNTAFIELPNHTHLLVVDSLLQFLQ